MFLCTDAAFDFLHLTVETGTLTIGMVDQQYIHHMSYRSHRMDNFVVRIQKCPYPEYRFFRRWIWLKTGVRRGLWVFSKTVGYYGLSLLSISIFNERLFRNLK